MKNHVYTKDGWKRSKQTRERIRHIQYKEAAIPEIVWSLDIDDLRESSLLDYGMVSQSRTKPIVVWLFGPSMLGTKIIRSWSYLLRLAIDKGHQAKAVSLSQCIESYFDKDEWRTVRADIRSARVLVVLLDSSNHKLLPQILGTIYTHRATIRATTIFVSKDNVAAMTGKYGAEISRQFKSSSLIRRIAIRRRKCAT